MHAWNYFLLTQVEGTEPVEEVGDFGDFDQPALWKETKNLDFYNPKKNKKTKNHVRVGTVVSKGLENLIFSFSADKLVFNLSF